MRVLPPTAASPRVGAVPAKIRQGEMIDPENLLTAATAVRIVGCDLGPLARRLPGTGVRIGDEQLARERRAMGR